MAVSLIKVASKLTRTAKKRRFKGSVLKRVKKIMSNKPSDRRNRMDAGAINRESKLREKNIRRRKRLEIGVNTALGAGIGTGFGVSAGRSKDKQKRKAFGALALGGLPGLAAFGIARARTRKKNKKRSSSGSVQVKAFTRNGKRVKAHTRSV